MNKAILNTEVQKFITDHIDADIASLLLKGTCFQGVDTKEIVEQIEAKKRSKHKLPTWYHTENIYYPNKLNIEQTSSEITASYKASLINGMSVVDLTGGFGVDCFYFSKCFKNVVHCELDKHLSELVNHNYRQLDANNIETQNIDGIEYLKQSNRSFDCIYADPSRRHDRKGKVFFLNDCLPNIPDHLEAIFGHTKNLMIKTSPLLDLSVGIGELNYVKTIHVVAVNNEVKELLWILNPDTYGENISVKTINISKGHQTHYDFCMEEEKNYESPYSMPRSYLYEPNVAILKAGAFHSISRQFQVFKLQKHSHLYTNDQLIDFPGRRFKIEQVLPYHIKTIKGLGLKKANITTRNFPETVQQIRKKLALKDGGDSYLFFTTDAELNKIVVVTTKVL